MTTKVFVTGGYIITLQLGYVGTVRLDHFCEQKITPGVPLPVVFVSMYAIILDMFTVYCTGDDSTQIFANVC
jgi:hypothetical protein